MAYITSEQYRDAVFSQDARHQLKVIFNGVELEDADNYCEKFTLKSRVMSNSSKVFSLDNFISDEAQLILHDIEPEQVVGPVDIQIGTLVGETYEYVPIGIFNIQDLPTTDKNKTTIKLRDNSVKFDFNYNAKPLMDANGGSATKLQILQDICLQAGVVCNITDFIGASDLVGSYDNSITARTYISYLAEQAGALATINRQGELIFVYLNALVDQQIPIDIVEKYQNGEKFKISRVVYEDAIRKYEKPTKNEMIAGDNLYLNTANLYISSQEQINAIYEIVKNFEIDSFKTGKVIGNPAIDKYDLIKIIDGDKIFRTLATYTMTYNGKILMTFETVIDQVKKQENITKNSDEVFKRTVKTSIDDVVGKIEMVVEETNKQNQKIAKVTQTVDELNSKISDIADITISGEDTDAQVELDNINQSEPIRLVIRPIGESISYDYPHEDYPQEDFSKIRTIRFTNTKTEEMFDYILPMDLLYYDSENYDEFILDYEGQTCMVNKRVGYNADGTTYVLDSERIIECDEYPRILLTEGDYKVQVLGYDTAYIFVRLMAQNIYTTQFYTKAETDSIISQTSQSIDLSVNAKLSNYSTTKELNAQLELKVDTNELVSEINASADVINLRGNRVIIDSDNFKLTSDGTITANAGTFSGTINTGKDLTVGDNAYIGQNQSASAINQKYLYFSDDIYLKRTSVGGSEALNIYAPFFGVNSNLDGQNTSRISVGGTNTRIQAKNHENFIETSDYSSIMNFKNDYINITDSSITSSRQITNVSDERLKQNIENIDVSWIDELKLKEFEYISTPDKKQIGLIAQDYLGKDYSKYFIEKIKIPNDEQQYYGISYGNITNALIQYCQELKQEINTLKNEINSLKESEK